MRISGRRGDQRSWLVLDASKNGVTFDDVTAVARQAVARTAERELDVFPQVIADFEREPGALLQPGRREPVALGVDLVSVTALTTLIGAALGGVLKDTAGNVLAESLSEPTQQALARLFRARGARVGVPRQSPDPKVPASERPIEVTAVILAPTQVDEIVGWTKLLFDSSHLSGVEVILALDAVIQALQPGIA